MEFNSQICTTKIQSERLLALGLKRETADMGIVKSTNEIYVGCPTDYSFENGLHIPAWSLHRLIEMLPENIAKENEMPSTLNISLMDGEWCVEYADFLGPDFSFHSVELIDAIFDMLTKLKENGMI